MRTHLLAALLFLAAPLACAQPAPPPIINPNTPPADPRTPKTLSPDSSLDDILDALNARGRSLKDFEADVKLSDTDNSFGTTESRTGRAWLENRDNGQDARIRVSFDKRQREDTKPVADKLDYVLDAGWLTDRDYHKKIEIKRQVLKPGQKLNLFKLGEGPFPLPIGQDKEEVKGQFDATKNKPADSDPPGTAHIQLKPKDGTRFKRKFDTIEVWVDQKTSMPVKIETVDANKTRTRTTELTNLKLNAGIDDSVFQLPEIKENENWQRRNEPYEE